MERLAYDSRCGASRKRAGYQNIPDVTLAGVGDRWFTVAYFLPGDG